MLKKITISMAEFRVVHNPCILESIGIGSCAVICLFDRKRKIAGMAHAMLPDSKQAVADVNPLRFVDKAVDVMLSSMHSLGCKNTEIRAKIIGGAEMFRSILTTSHVSENNIKAAREKLEKEGIRIVAEEVGGNQGRSVWFDTETGDVVVGRIHGPTIEI